MTVSRHVTGALLGKQEGGDDVDYQCTHAQRRAKYSTLTLQDMYETSCMMILLPGAKLR